MRWTDLLLLLIILMAAWSGWRNGFLYTAVGLIALVGSILAGFFLYPYLSGPMARIFPALGSWTLPVSFLTAILVTHLLLSLFFNQMLEMLPPFMHQNVLNKLLGILPGTINGLITASVIALMLIILPLTDGFSREWRNSSLANRMTQPVVWAEQKLSPVFDKPVSKMMSELTIDPHSERAVKLPYTTDHIWPRADLETQMLRLLNEERAKAGETPLMPDTALKSVARAHSVDMFERGYFSHITPGGRDPFERMREAHIQYLTAGENLALAPTLSIAHNGLMHSPGHRANILNPSFHRVGIGIIDGGMYGIMVSQEFRN